MFCPNCGNDCGSANFCPHCGTKLEAPVKKPTIWAVGMPCPHCGGTQLEEGKCVFCGADLIVEMPDTPVFDHGQDSYEIPYRKFYPNPFIKYCLSVERDAVVIETPSFFVKTKLRIPYDRLTAVKFIFTAGEDVHIAFYWNDPTPNAPSPRESIFNGNRGLFEESLEYHVFYVLKHLVPATVEFSVEYPSARAIPECNVNLERYFEVYNPLRYRAVNALCHDEKLSQAEAWEVVNDYFNKKQKALYDADSRLAVRDYHRLLRDRNRRLDAK